ncbi:MAG: peptidase M28, partial [Sphingopyxis sp.]|nr:peptidase M28 [Sphingopyxis sp.]
MLARCLAPLLLVSTALTGCATTGASTTASSMPEISLATMQDVTTQLASDEFEGRAPGTRGEQLTVDLLIDRFRAAGLQPGNNGSWVQDVPLVETSATN